MQKLILIFWREQYRRCNNVEIEGISDSISDENLESKGIDILAEIDVNVESKDIEACHRIGKSSPKRSIVRFVNRKVCKSTLKNRKKLRSVDANILDLLRTSKVFINENLSPYFSKIAFNCRKLKRAGKIMKVYSHEGIIHIVRTLQDKPKKFTTSTIYQIYFLILILNMINLMMFRLL